MSIYDDDHPRPRPVETAPRWRYNIGAKVLFVKQFSEPAQSFSVRFGMNPSPLFARPSPWPCCTALSCSW
jgi:hypothetical protein